MRIRAPLALLLTLTVATPQIALAQAPSKAPVKRKAIYDRVQNILADELPYITLWVQDDVAVASRRLRGFTLYPGGDYTGLVKAFMINEERTP